MVGYRVGVETLSRIFRGGGRRRRLHGVWSVFDVLLVGVGEI